MKFWSDSVLVLGFGSILESENKLNIFDRSQCELIIVIESFDSIL